MICLMIRAAHWARRAPPRAVFRVALRAAFCALFLAPFSAQAYQQPGDRALLIGIGAYEEPNQLAAPTTDVAAMRGLLTGRLKFRDDQIKVLTDERATRAAILSAMRTWLIDGSRPGDRIFLYFSGHGYQQDDEDGDEVEDGKDETLVPVDHMTAGMIIDDEIRVILDAASDRRVTAVFDSCFSGTVARSAVFGAAGQGQTKARMWNTAMRSRSSQGSMAAHQARVAAEQAPIDVLFDMTPRRVIWTAASANELAFERSRGDDRYGVFTRAFIEAVENSPGEAPSRQDVMRHIQTRSAAFCAQSQGCMSLTPTLEASAAQRGSAVAWTPSEVREIVASPAVSISAAPSVRQDAAAGPAPSASLSAPSAQRPNVALSPLTQRPNVALSPLTQRPNVALSPLTQRPNVALSPLTQRPNVALSPLTQRPNAALSPPPQNVRPQHYNSQTSAPANRPSQAASLSYGAQTPVPASNVSQVAPVRRTRPDQYARPARPSAHAAPIAAAPVSAPAPAAPRLRPQLAMGPPPRDRVRPARPPAQPPTHSPRPPFTPQAGAIDQSLRLLADRAPRRLGAAIIPDDPAYGPPRPGLDLFNLSVRGDHAGRVIALWSDGQRLVQLLPRFNDPYLRAAAVPAGGGAIFPDPRSSGWRLPRGGVIFVGVVSAVGGAERFVGGQEPLARDPVAYLRTLWAALSSEPVWSGRILPIRAP